MTSDHRREIASINLIACVEGLIVTGALPEHLVNYVMGFVAAARRTHGLAPWSPPQSLLVCNDNVSIVALDVTLDRISEVLA